MAQAKQTQGSVITFRLLLLALLPALMIFIAEEMTRPFGTPGRPGAASEAETARAQGVTHIYATADQDAMLKLANQSRTIELGLDQYLAAPQNNAGEAMCMDGMRSGIAAYLTPILVRLHDEIAASNYMRDEEDEKFINGAIVKTSATTMLAVPAMYDTLMRTMTNCPNNTAVALRANEIRSFLIQVTRALQVIENPGTKVALAAPAATVVTQAPATTHATAVTVPAIPAVNTAPVMAVPAATTAAPAVNTEVPAATVSPTPTTPAAPAPAPVTAPVSSAAPETVPLATAAGPIVSVPTTNAVSTNTLPATNGTVTTPATGK